MPPGAGGDHSAIAQAVVAQLLSQSGGGGSSGSGAPKPKIDVNVTLLQILKILARICDHLGIQVPVSDMVATSGDLSQMAQAQAGGSPASSIQPIQPIAPAFAPKTADDHRQALADLLALARNSLKA